MNGMKKEDKGRISFGTFFMLFMTLLVIGGLAYVIPKLSSDAPVDLSKLNVKGILNLEDKGTEYTGEQIPVQQAQAEVTVKPQVTPEVRAEAVVTPVPRKGGSFRAVFGGTVAVEDGVRKSAYLSDSKTYDFTANLDLLREEMQGEINAVFFENLLMDNQKVSNLVIPSNGGEMLTAAGFDTVCFGFSKVLDKNTAGMLDSVAALNDLGLNVVGAYADKNAAGGILRKVNGVNVAILQYTGNLSSTGQKQIKRTGETWAVPVADDKTMAEGIRNAKNMGAEVVIVCLQWGADGAKSPTKSQRNTAKALAEAGADLIIGNGSRIVQPAEYITVTDELGQGRSVLCAWSLGTLLAESRNANRTAGMLLEVTMDYDGEGHTRVLTAEYVPTWIWQYKQDSITYYRTMPADRNVPDGMTEADLKAMDKAVALIETTMTGSPVTRKAP